MYKEKINNVELQRLVALKCDKLDFADVTDEDIKKISNITLRGILINGNPSGIDLDCVESFPGLEKLSIYDYAITQDLINTLTELKQVKILEFGNCSFEDIDFENIQEKLSRIRFTGCESLPAKYPKTKKVQVAGSKIDFSSIDFKQVEDVAILESIVSNAHDLDEFSEIKSVNLDGSTLFNNEGNLISDIKVSENTVYTHALKLDISNGRDINYEI